MVPWIVLETEGQGRAKVIDRHPDEFSVHYDGSFSLSWRGRLFGIFIYFNDSGLDLSHFLDVFEAVWGWRWAGLV